MLFYAFSLMFPSSFFPFFSLQFLPLYFDILGQIPQFFQNPRKQRNPHANWKTAPKQREQATLPILLKL